MWHLSLHKRPARGQTTILFTAPRRGRRRVPERERQYILGVGIAFTDLELDIWRPLRPDELERRRNRPMEGEIIPLPTERPDGMPDGVWQRIQQRLQRSDT